MPRYSNKVKEHIQKQIVSEDYLLTTEFTLQELNDICTYRMPTMTYGKVPIERMPESNEPEDVEEVEHKKSRSGLDGTSYADYLKKAGITKKNPRYV